MMAICCEISLREAFHVLALNLRRTSPPQPKPSGVPSLVKFFDSDLGEELAAQGKLADLVVANNVLAQVPDLNGFLAGGAQNSEARGGPDH